MVVTDYYMSLSDEDKLVYRHGYKMGQNETYKVISDAVCKIFDTSSNIIDDIKLYFKIRSMRR